MSRQRTRHLILIVSAACFVAANVFFAQRPWSQAEAASPVEASAVQKGLKADDPLGRIMAIRQCEALGEEAPKLMPALVEASAFRWSSWHASCLKG